MTACYKTHSPLPLGQYEIYGGNAAAPVIRDADIYVSLQADASCKLADITFDAGKTSFPADVDGISGKIVEICFSIDDGQVPGDVVRFHTLVKWLCSQLKRNKKIHIGCIGGHGRTGMVLGAIAVEFLYEKNAIQYVRERYCQRAVETKAQVSFLQEHYFVSAVEPGDGLFNTSSRRAIDSQSDAGHYSAIDSVLSLYRQHLGKLQKKGLGYVARCPFHDDRRPSLRIDNKKGTWLWYCDVCTTGGNVYQLQERMRSRQRLASETGRDEHQSSPVLPLGDHVEDYDYRGMSGDLIFQVRRFERIDSTGKRRKSFLQRRPDRNGGWLNNVPAEMRVIYNLPEVLKADTVLICEGEKDCNTATALGFTATCNPGGAGKWEARYSAFLQSKKTIIIPDRDGPGEGHEQQVFESVKAYAHSVNIVRVPNGKDLTEWVEHGGTAQELKALIDSTPAEDLISASVVRDHTKTFAKTDSGNAERFAAEHLEAVRYCNATGKWYVWDGTRWVKDDTGQVYRLAKMTVRGIQTQALKLIDDDQRRALTKHAILSESEPRLNAMLSLAEKELGIPVRVAELDSDPMLLNVRNGTLDLRTGTLFEHRRSDLITKIAPIEYNPSAQCPRWLTFVSEVTSTNNAKYLQRAMGYSLTGEIVEHAFFFLYGTGANGKTTFLEVLRHVLGDYAQTADFGSFMVSQRSGPRNDLAKLHGARMVTATESEDGMRLSEGIVKQVTGGDTVTARFLYGEYFEFKPQFKLWLASNHKPSIRGTDEGIWRRVKVIDFKLQLPNTQRDLYLTNKLLKESDGILNWALQGLAEYRENGLMEPEDIAISTADYRREQDLIGHFLDTCCTCSDNISTPARELYEAYRSWANSTQERVINERQFSNALATRGFTKVRLAAGTMWKGIGIKNDATSMQDISLSTNVGSAASVANSQNFADLL